MSRRSRGLSAALLGSAVALGIAGCGPARPTVDPSADADAVIAAVRAAVPEAATVLAGESRSLQSTSLSTRLYAPDAQDADAPALVDRALKAAWAAIPLEPDSITISLALAPAPAEPSLAELDGVDMNVVAESLGIDDPAIVHETHLSVDAAELEKRYGAHPGDADG